MVSKRRRVPSELPEGEELQEVRVRYGPGEGVRMPERVHVEDVDGGGRVRDIRGPEDDVDVEVVRDDGRVEGHGEAHGERTTRFDVDLSSDITRMTLSPSRLSASLRSISDRILASKNPSRSAVASEIRRVLAAMEDTAPGQFGPDTKIQIVAEKVGDDQVLTAQIDGKSVFAVTFNNETEYWNIGLDSDVPDGSGEMFSDWGHEIANAWAEAGETDDVEIIWADVLKEKIA
jgi:hypothetical protein